METGSDDGARGDFRRAAAHDSPGPEARIEDAVMRLARLLGRQIAREHVQQPEAANDNAPTREARELQATGDHDPALRPLRPLFVRPAKHGFHR